MFFRVFLIDFSSQKNYETFILPVVSVLVLPQRISSTSPIFSGASSFLTRILSSLNILSVVKAKETPMVNGSPSGTQTTKSTTSMLAYLRLCCKSTLYHTSSVSLRISISTSNTKTNRHANKANLMKWPSKLCNFVCRAVS